MSELRDYALSLIDDDDILCIEVEAVIDKADQRINELEETNRLLCRDLDEAQRVVETRDERIKELAENKANYDVWCNQYCRDVEEHEQDFCNRLQKLEETNRLLRRDLDESARVGKVRGMRIEELKDALKEVVECAHDSDDYDDSMTLQNITYVCDQLVEEQDSAKSR